MMNEPIAVMAISNNFGVVIFGIQSGINDTITTGFTSGGGGYVSRRTTRLFQDENGGAYFKRYNVKYYLNEFMKV